MKNKILFSLLIVVGLFVLVGCTNNKNSNQSSNSKSYNVNGVSIKLDKDDSRDKIKYKIFSNFTSDYKSSTSSYTIFNDNSKDKYDLSNIAFRLEVNADIMNTSSTIENEKTLVNKKDTFKNVVASEKIINSTTWFYYTFDNYYDGHNQFKEHLYITERKIDNYYYVYKVFFIKAEDIAEFEEAFMNSIVFE